MPLTRFQQPIFASIVISLSFTIWGWHLVSILAIRFCLVVTPIFVVTRLVQVRTLLWSLALAHHSQCKQAGCRLWLQC